MHQSLERLIQLQTIDNATEASRRVLAEMPARIAAIEARVADRAAAVGSARQRLSDNQTARREIEKELAVIQGRLSKFRDQLMEVKTNKEYQAMQKEIAVAEREVRSFEDRILELMLAADEQSADVKTAEQALAQEQRNAEKQRADLDRERLALEDSIGRAASDRQRVAGSTDPEALALFEHIARGRRGLAVVEARNGHCTVCHVRLRPQVFNEIRRNEMLIQCDSCQRILYYAPGSAVSESEAPQI
jgi:predicted  nucleic acid-binding Zn-ribbon protein